MLSLEQAREFLRIDGTDNDNIINALLEAIPEYIEVTTGMAIPQQNTGPLINTVSRLYCSCGITRNNQKVKNYKEQ